jgi:hypothetical protein
MAEARRVALRLEEPADGTLTTDSARFRQVLYNLLSNAIKFTPGPGTVTVRCEWVARAEPEAEATSEEQATALRVSVADTGVGIAPEDQELIWDEFRQGKARPATNPEGTGLGLALTRRLVGLLGGSIWLKTTPGQGSTFTFVIPRQMPPPQSQHATATADAAGRPLALVIEDHPATNKLLADWLAEVGLATASAFDGAEGLEQAQRLQPRLIVLDLLLPRLDGWQVMTALKSDSRTAAIPVVIVTVTEDRQPTLGLGVQEYFVKPIERGDFLRRLRAALPKLLPAERALKALVVDDDVATRRFLGDLLRLEGIEVIEAADGREALARLSECRVDLVLLDLVMPELDGFAVVAEMRSRPEWQAVPILVVTGKEVTDGDRERLNGRIHALLVKTRLTPEHLRAHLQQLGLCEEGGNGNRPPNNPGADPGVAP